MIRKRGNNEGSIHKRPNGTWRAQISIKGGRLGFTAKRRAEAQAWLMEIGNQVDRGLTLKAARLAFNDFLDEWLKTVKARLTFESWRSYNQVVHDYISPVLGSTKLRELTPLLIQRLYNGQLDKGIGERTIQKTHAVIRASLNSAKKMGLLTHNPASATSPPKAKVREMQILNEKQIRELLRTAKVSDGGRYALYYLAIVTGMRQGELLALHWSEVDLAKGTLHVKYSLKRVPGEGLQPRKPKTTSSVRSIKIGLETCQVLHGQGSVVAEMKAKAGDDWHDLGYVFPASNGQPIEPAEAYRGLHKMLQRAGLTKIRFHDLRHTAASLMLNNGVDVLIASKRLGHAKPSITLDFYGHLLPNIQSQVADLLEAVVRGG
ncbi:MAG: site-specific integrase [Anaerolineales bacterium]